MKYCPSMNTPWDDPDPPCDVCGEELDRCICLMCPNCGECGDLYCYSHHGMVISEKQKMNLLWNEALWEDKARTQYLAELEFEKEMEGFWKNERRKHAPDTKRQG